MPACRKRLLQIQTLALSLATLLAFGAGSTAHAQDHAERMTNIGAEHAQQMNDYGRMAAENYANSQYDEYYEEDDDGYYGSSSPPAPMTLEQQYLVQALRRDQEIIAELQADPRFERFANGGWDHYQSRQPAAPGEYCAATYLSRHGMITLTGVDQSWDGAMLIFVGEHIPKPDTFQTISVTLKQTSDPPATVQVHNLARVPQMHELGTLVFAVPSMDAALGGMTDALEFIIEIEGAEVFRMSWKDGLKARDQLRKCVRRR
jgi:hypothetical protein